MPSSNSRSTAITPEGTPAFCSESRGLGMGIRSRLVIAAALCLVAFVSAASAVPSTQDDRETAVRAFAAGDPVAVINWLPPEVSNGTWWNLDGRGSYDTDGTIVNYTWKITINNVTSYLWGQGESFKFKVLGLYLITLTVTDNDGRSNSAFTAVYSIVDADKDGLPDWWEMTYFYSLDETGSDDHDGDGYTNLEEFASGHDPTVRDPQPGIVQDLKDNWYLVVIAAAIVIGAVLVLMPRLKRKRKEEEKKKIEAAIEIEKAIHGEE